MMGVVCIKNVTFSLNICMYSTASQEVIKKGCEALKFFNPYFLAMGQNKMKLRGHENVNYISTEINFYLEESKCSTRGLRSTPKV
jgi:hypothetical protein